MFKRIAAVLLGLTMALGFSGAVQASPNDCSNGTICFYEDAVSPYGQIATYSGSIPRNTCQHIFWETGISYVYNRTSTRWFLFRDSLCQGAHIEAPPGYAGQAQALVNGTGWDNDIVAVFRTSYTS